MFDPDDYELHEAQKHACKMAKERDEARVAADRLTAELEMCAAVLPGAYYMDPPDGGDVSVSEQLRRMAKDAERYRYLRRKVAIAGAQFLVMNLPSPVYVAPDAAAEFDSALDAERSARAGARTPTPVGWSDTDWIRRLRAGGAAPAGGAAHQPRQHGCGGSRLRGRIQRGAGSETSGARCRNARRRFRAEARMTPNLK